MNELCFPIPPVKTQLESYKNFYASLKKEDIQKPLAGLSPFLKTGYAYVYQLLLKEKNEPQVHHLASFWEQAKKDIANNCLTLPRFFNHNLRLAVLLAETQEKAPFFYGELMKSIRDFYNKGLWLDIEAYDELKLDSYFANPQIFKGYPYPFHRLMILYLEKGDLSLRMFIESFIEDEFPFALAVLPAKGGGPHGDYYADPLSFFIHDLLHWCEFVHDLAPSPQKWPVLRQALQRFYHSLTPQNREPLIVLFLLLHEILPFVPENGEISVEEVWSQWVDFAKENMASFPDHLESFVLEQVLADTPLSSSYSFTPCPDLPIETLENSYRIHLRIELTKSPSPLGVATFTISFAPLDTHRETLTILDITTASLSDDCVNALKGVSFPVLSRRTRFNLLFADPITLINKASGKELLSDLSPPQEIKNHVNTFLSHLTA
ncbi:hypothetical protein [Candidatus Neptunochlamydia vexilliferae]|nr:hypothetical protein [Candidatus Neptunochlamydia vexilliferae]